MAEKSNFNHLTVHKTMTVGQAEEPNPHLATGTKPGIAKAIMARPIQLFSREPQREPQKLVKTPNVHH